jgi:hypothetical protein
MNPDFLNAAMDEEVSLSSSVMVASQDRKLKHVLPASGP